jgi:hypothetical protein
VYHRDWDHAGNGDHIPVTAEEIGKFRLVPCIKCMKPKEFPENVVATAAALRSMFVVEGTEAEVNQMAEDFLTDLAKFGYTVHRIRQRREKNTTDTVVDYSVTVDVTPRITTLSTGPVLDAEPNINSPTVQQEDNAT